MAARDQPHGASALKRPGDEERWNYLARTAIHKNKVLPLSQRCMHSGQALAGMPWHAQHVRAGKESSSYHPPPIEKSTAAGLLHASLHHCTWHKKLAP